MPSAPRLTQKATSHNADGWVCSRSQRRDVTVFSSPAPSTLCLSLCLVGCPIPFAGVPWHRKPGFKLVAVKDVRRLTGLELSELLSRQYIQRLTRIDESGAREEFVRIPVELLIEEPAD